MPNTGGRGSLAPGGGGGWQYELTRHATRDLKRLDRAVQARVFAALDRLVLDPDSCDIDKVAGEANLYRQRVGDYRLIFGVDRTRRVFVVQAVGPRDQVYRRR
jgi:mRNA interferase RelE/StbE